MKKPTKYHSTVIITAALTTAAIGGTALAKTLDIEIPAPGAFTTSIDNQYWPCLVGLLNLTRKQVQPSWRQPPLLL